MSRSVTRQDNTDRHHHREKRSNSPQKRERPRRPKDCSIEDDFWIPAAAGAAGAAGAAVQWQSQQHLKSRPKRLASAVEKENQDNIDRENRILLRKILEQHHGIRRHSDIPASRRLTRSNSATRPSTLAPPSSVGPRTSNQINKQRLKHKTDYENLLLLQKIQSAKPSKEIVKSLANLRVTN